ncbi:PREDICTED: MICOS complex subunit MIC13 homolog QIL1 [Diuraphis noxia]|uniref:MICOS complex subunit MIC13 homolog QIL1 n=1 Tax=Diuraphis noxia TaxID=143948 RepID=UPI000763A273|nr:PREDICTED: MICOS complex subunit MIC13 homolog QIL1 [Diuraphis noxia]
MSKLNKFISYTIRGALFGATIFGSSELGIWKDGETSREVAKIIIAILTPIAKKAESEMPEQVKQLPSVENLKSTSTACWNKGVYNAGEFVIDVPNKCVCAANKAYQLVEVQVNKSKEN